MGYMRNNLERYSIPVVVLDNDIGDRISSQLIMAEVTTAHTHRDCRVTFCA